MRLDLAIYNALAHTYVAQILRFFNGVFILFIEIIVLAYPSTL
jgi:hypothetical protein